MAMNSINSRRIQLQSYNARWRLLHLSIVLSVAVYSQAFSWISPSVRATRLASFISTARPIYKSSTALCMAERKTESEEAEWKALLAAFQMYKAAYGDLKVPSRFIVPGMPPWPESAWGMKLGQRVAAIRSTGKFVHNNESRRKILEDMGFQWRLREADTSTVDVSFDQIYDALRAYRQEVQPDHKTLKIPANFVVPDCDPWPESTRGLPLGKKLPTIRSKSFPKKNPDAKEKLAALGFEFDGKAAANDTRFQKVYDALVTYKKQYGDLLVPQPFVVPENSDEWPENTWGLRLGARVNAIRSQGTFVNTNPDRRKQLDDIGFVWSPPPSSTGRRRGRRKKEEIQASEVETEKPDSAEDRSKSLESASSAMEDLFGPSFAFGGGSKFKATNGKEDGAPSWGLEGARELEAARAAEEAAKQPQDEYEEPRLLSDTLETATENAVACGVIEPIGEDGRTIKGKREKDIPWFNDDFGQDFVFEDVVEALTLYKSIYGNFSGFADEEFVIPAPDGGSVFETDDDDTDSFDVDASARAAAAIASFEAGGSNEESEDPISAEIRRLQKESESSLAMETEVAVQPKTSTKEWPEYLAGMPLGNIVQRIRDGSLEVKHLPERKAQLDAIGFDWDDPKYFIDIPFEKAMCAMYAYYLVRGDMFVYEDFVMPDEEPWPKALAGYEIGKAVRRIRELQHFFEAYHTEKVALLRAIDFVWFPTMALPIDPDEPEMTSEMLMISAMGHPDYAKMIDIPMGLPDKIMADGPFFESDDPKQWWRKWHNWDYVKDYWYAQGRRDNAYVLRGMGYPTLADEHEAKYGPGMFKQIEQLMKELDEGIDSISKEEKDAYVERLNFFREEMTGCRDLPPKERKKLLEELDTALLALMTGEKIESVTEETLETLSYLEEGGEEFDDVVEEEIEDEYQIGGGDFYDEDDADLGIEEEEELEEAEEEEEFDVEGELGLDEDDYDVSESEDEDELGEEEVFL